MGPLFSAERLNSDSSSEDSDDEEESEQNGVDQAEVGVWLFTKIFPEM